jgi:hypothetical protein
VDEFSVEGLRGRLWRTVVRGPYLDVTGLSQEEFLVLLLAAAEGREGPRPPVTFTAELDIYVNRELMGQ